MSQQAIPHIMNGKPVWSPTYGWMLVHASDRMFLLSDGSSIPFSDVGDVFITPPQFSESIDTTEPPLSKAELFRQNEVWVEPISSDPVLRNELRGWCRKKDRFVENEFGSRFYLDSYGSKWLAFANML